eukprot:TRINITY_DN1531_c0_g1_i1.p1 TRINITY_DN1531_c0_g1~~TRINITY_DN1531_c0_g1_i1.p1  ORF type:complete len:486 (-),score=114.04 TRINITY_DN1531_c0_g1_i1:85-1542(-)
MFAQVSPARLNSLVCRQPSQQHTRSYVEPSWKDQRRREKNKQNLRNPTEEAEALGETDYVDLRERLGQEVLLNYQLLHHNLAPQKDAYRNLHIRGLVQRAYGTTDQNKALHVKTYSKSTPPQFLRHGKDIQSEHFDPLMEEVTDYMESNDIFVEDASFSGFDIRVITDNAASNLFFRNALSRTRNVPVREFTPDLVVYLPTGLQLENPEKYQLKGSEFSIYSIMPTLVRAPLELVEGETPEIRARALRDQPILVLAGTDHPTAISNALMSAAGMINARNQASLLAFNADAIESPEGDVVVFGQDRRTALKKVLGDVKFKSDGGVTLGGQGLTSAFNSVLSKYDPKTRLNRGDIVFEADDKSKYHVSPRNLKENSPSQVGKMVFFVEKGEPMELNSEQAVQYLLSGYDGKTFKPHVESVTQQSLENLKKSMSNAKAFILPTGEKSEGIFRDIVQGKKPTGVKAFDSKGVEENLKKFFAATYPGVSL